MLAELSWYAPSLIIISGDIVQRPAKHHFQSAKQFLDQLPGPTVLVPGNHDIPVFNLFLRFTDPFRRYRQYICNELSPLYVDNDLVVSGMTSPRAWTLNFTEGTIDDHQLCQLVQTLRQFSTEKFKILVIHHPFLLPLDNHHLSLRKKRKDAIPIIDEAGVDLVLSGHLHRYVVGDAAAFHGFFDHSLLVAQASTTMSTRLRHDLNGYTLITLDPPRVIFQPRVWNGDSFDTSDIEIYRRHATIWHKINNQDTKDKCSSQAIG